MDIENTNIAIVGDGVWGLALYKNLKEKNDLTLFTRKSKQECMVHIKKLYPDWAWQSIAIENDMRQLSRFRWIVIAIASEGVDRLLENLKEVYNGREALHLLCASKGLSGHRGGRFFHDYAQYLFSDKPVFFSYLSGPTFARELYDGKITYGKIAAKYKSEALGWQNKFNNLAFHLSSTDDRIGVAFCGLYKNLVALWLGFLIGHGSGENTKAVFFQKAVSECASMIKAMGGERETAYGLCGLGDIFLSATSHHSRNFQAGYELANRQQLKEGQVVESLGNLERFETLVRSYQLHLMLITSARLYFVEKQIQPCIRTLIDSMNDNIMARQSKAESYLIEG